MTSVSEPINFNDYKDKPEELLPISKKFFSQKKFEQAIDILEQAIRIAVKKFGKEDHIECAKYYSHYADGLIRKLMENEDILAIPTQAEDKKDADDDSDKESESIRPGDQEQSNTTEIGQTKRDNNFEPQPAEDDSDENIATENLQFAEMIYLQFLKDYDSLSPSKLEQDIKKYYFELSSVYQKFGELEMCNSDFRKAAEFYLKALQIRSKYDDTFSRCIAEIYFNLASVYDFDAKKCLLCYYKTKIIMEHHLTKELDLAGKNSIAAQIIYSQEDLELNDIAVDYENLLINKKVIDTIEQDQVLMQNDEIADLTGIISELHQKIEDVVIDIKEFEKFVKEKQELAKANDFTNDYDKSKVVDISSTSIIKKRPRSDENKDNNEHEGGKRTKLEDDRNQN